MVAAVAPQADSPMRARDQAESLSKLWQDRIEQAKKDRARFEPIWHQNLAFAAGKHWLEWSRADRRLKLPKLERGRVRMTMNVLNQYRMTALGELSSDDFRPELLFERDDRISEEYEQQANAALGYGWDTEWDGDEVMLDLLQKLIDLGTGAIQCVFDPTVGPVLAEVPHNRDTGERYYDPGDAYKAVDKGASLSIKQVHEGRIRWQPLGPFSLLVPPGIEHDRDFPWEITVAPVHIDKLREEFGAAAESLEPQSVAGLNQLGQNELGDAQNTDPEADPGQPGKLSKHVLRYRCFERPSTKYPEGRTAVIAGSDYKVLRSKDTLPYRAPDGTARSGITYFRYWNVTGRFWGKALIEDGIGIQRAINKRRSQVQEIIDRGLPKVFVEEGTLKTKPRGLPVEVIEIARETQRMPVTDPGVAPGQWMFEDVKALLEDLERAMGIRAVSLGSNPPGVGNYSQLALLRENDQIKTNPVVTRMKLGIGSVVEDTVYDIRRYWGPEKQIAIAGDENMLQTSVFDATKIPPFYVVRVAKGASKPRSQAAELKKIDDLAAYSINSGQPLPTQWLYDSYEDGKPVDLPTPTRHDQLDKALLENHQISTGSVPTPAYYDDHTLHIQVARSLQAQADAAGRSDVSHLAEEHILAHEQLAQQNIQQNALAAGVQLGGAPAEPGAPQDQQQQMPFPHGNPMSLFMQHNAQNFG